MVGGDCWERDGIVWFGKMEWAMAIVCDAGGGLADDSWAVCYRMPGRNFKDDTVLIVDSNKFYSQTFI